MSWLERGRERLQELGKQAKPRSEQFRDEAAPRLQAARTSAEKAGSSIRSRMDEAARAFREGANGDETSEAQANAHTDSGDDAGAKPPPAT